MAGFRSPSSPTARRGHMVVMFAVLLVVALALLAFAIDTGVIMMTRTELQRSVDSAVLAGAAVLAQDEVTEQEVFDETIEFLTANGVSSKDLDDDLTIEFGTWDADTRLFTSAPVESATALRVEIESRDNSMFFAGILGNSMFSATVDAIAVNNASGQERDIMLVLDCSGSMDNDSDSPEQPMTAVKDGAKLLCNTITSDDRVGLTVYNWENADEHETGHVEVSLTDNAGSVKSRIAMLTAAFYTGGTNIAGGIHIGGESLDANGRDEARKELVVLTDGRANDFEPPYGEDDSDADESALAWANHIRSLGIIVHSISVGDSADHELMQQIAGGSLSDDDPLKGKHFAVTGDIEDYAAGLLAAFEELGTGSTRSVLVD